MKVTRAGIQDPDQITDTTDLEFTHVVATVTASGNTTIYTPAAGKSVRLHWISAISDPSSTTSPLINIKIGTLALYRVYAIQKQQRKTGAVDDPLIINLSTAVSVAVSALVEDV